MEQMEDAIRKDPSLPEKWRAEGERQYQSYLKRMAESNQKNQLNDLTEATPIIIPIVFHMVDIAATQAGITDRDIYEQVEILNRDYAGKKMDEYTTVIPPEIASRVGRIPVKFVLARRDPNGALTTGIERRVATSPNHVNIKANATGGLDAWDETKYLNVWCGTFSGSDAGLLGISTFPFTTGQGPQGVVINIASLPYTSSASRSYYPEYSEGSTLSHEIGHYFYLFHTFGDQSACNNSDFKIQAGWPLPFGAGPEGDDTPMQKGTSSDGFVYGNPSMNYKDGCAPESFGAMYGCFMNYFDDRALFMFSEGMRKRVEGCIALYRPGLLTSDGATPPSAITDAYLVNVSPRGTPERRSYIVNNTPFQAMVRNGGTSLLTAVTLNTAIDAGAPAAITFPLNLQPGADTTLNLDAISVAAGNHTLTVYTSSPNASTDNFLNNDTLQSFINILSSSATIPFSEDFTSATFPPAGWQLFNPNSGSSSTWTRNTTSGFIAAGSAFFDNFTINQSGTLDDLVTPAIDPGAATSALLTFKVAYAVYNTVDVSAWDGLEVYVSGDGGKTYNLAYKKSGNALTTVPATTSVFSALPSQPSKWRAESIDLTPYIISGKKLIIKFRNLNANGNNLFIDDISVAAANPTDAQVSAIISPLNNLITACSPITATATIKNIGAIPLTSAVINVNLNGTLIGTQSWTGSLTTGTTANVTLTAIPISPASGSNMLKIYTTTPNGVTDINAANDTTTIVFTKTNGAAIPLTEGFESVTFPPTGWTLNPSTGNIWQRVTPGSGSANSIKADFFNYPAASTFDITSPYINVSSQSYIGIAFDLAHKQSSSNADQLQIQVTNNCGATYTTVYDKTSNSGLVTTSSGTGAFTPTSAADWRHEIVPLTGSVLSTGNIQVRFVATSANGNNLYLDNINIDNRYQRDLSVTAINTPAGFECSAFAPQVVIANLGIDIVTSYSLNYSIDGGQIQTLPVTSPLASGATVTITLPVVNSLSPGSHTFLASTANIVTISGTDDQNTANDSKPKTFTSRQVIQTPVMEGFEDTAFPSPGWTLAETPVNGNTWVRKTPGSASDHSAFFDNWNYNQSDATDDIVSPAFNVSGADSVIIHYDIAHQYYPAATNDTFSIIASSDCGNTFTNILYNAGGTQLATAGQGQEYSSPLPSDWATRSVALGGPALANGSLVVLFRNKNEYGNNIFLDNINIEGLFRRDIAVVSIESPNFMECSSNITPKATIKNKGVEPVTGFTISYQIDNGAVQSTSISGINLIRDATMQVDLTPALSGLTGMHTITVYAANPVTLSGNTDQLATNDTLSKHFGISGSVSAPLIENFESSGFPPAGWVSVNPDANIGWEKAVTGRASTSSAFINNFNYPASERIDDLYSPIINYTGVDSVTLSFDLSAATRDFPGTTTNPLDTLEVLITRDCGNSFTSVYKKWGAELQTLNDPITPQTSEFIPQADYLWRKEIIDLTGGFIPDGPIQVVFRNTTNEGNNIFIDNVNLTTRILPSKLKEEGWLVLPNPFTGQFSIWHVQQPTNLRYITIYNAAGQMVWSQQYNSNAQKLITVDMKGKAAGLYIVNMGYSDQKNIRVKVIKL